MITTKIEYWKKRLLCDKGKHKFRDNIFGMTWCVICGQHSIKPSNIPLLETDKIITTNLT